MGISLGLTLFLLLLPAFSNLLSNKHPPKKSLFFERTQCSEPGKCQAWEELPTDGKVFISPHILESLLQRGADVGLDAGPLLPFPSEHLVH